MKQRFLFLSVWLFMPLVTAAQQSVNPNALPATVGVDDQVTEDVCVAYGPTLQESQNAFSSGCPWLVRQSCNQLPSGLWACSTADALSSVDRDQAGISQAEIPDESIAVESAQDLLLTDGEQCTVFGVSFDDAALAFSADCPWRVRDYCSVAASGEWYCSTSELVDSSSTGSDTIVQTDEDAGIASADEVSAEALPVAPQTPARMGEELCTSYGESFALAAAGFSSECPWRDRHFCDPLTSGGWACSTERLPGTANVLVTPESAATPSETSGLVDVENAADAEQPSDTTDAVESAEEPVEEPLQVSSETNTSIGTGVMNTVYKSGDLVIIAHDSGPDTDDMQAIVANRLIIDANPSINYIMVGATQGHQWTDPTRGSEAHTASLFPDWINAKASTRGTTSFDGASIITVADRVTSTLDNKGTVHIAEGGPSDFTAEVLQVLQSRGVPESLLKRIRVVQHSAGSSAWNEQQTSRSNLALVKSVASWVPIANGNVGGNASADFQEPKGSAMCQRFRNATSNSRYAAQWAWAYSIIDDARKCDQSDSVELLYILNDTSTKTFDQFASRYLR